MTSSAQHLTALDLAGALSPDALESFASATDAASAQHAVAAALTLPDRSLSAVTALSLANAGVATLQDRAVTLRHRLARDDGDRAQDSHWRAARAHLPIPRPATVLAALVLGTVVLAALVPQLFTSVDPLRTDPLAMNRVPSGEHLAGTDYLGRDVLARIIYGARYSLTIGVAATAIAVVLGVALGLSAGMSRGVVDTALARVVDVLASFPAILLALVVIGITGSGIVNLAITLGIATVPTYARVVRAQTRRVVRSDYVAQARTFGLTTGRMVARHVLPNALGVVPVIATIELGNAIIGAASLSFLGLGPQPPTPEWGAILAGSRDFLQLAWWTGVLPGVALTATVISANVLGRAWKRRYEGGLR